MYSGIYGENGSFFDTTGSSITETVHSYSRGKNVTDEVIPDGVIAIGKCTFYGQTELTSITFPETVSTIGRDAFRGCTGLTELRLPSSLVSLGSGAFADWGPNRRRRVHWMCEFADIPDCSRLLSAGRRGGAS